MARDNSNIWRRGSERMQLFNKDLSRFVAVIAEVGVNHEGDADVAARLVEAAAKAGADAVKFQSYTPERFISPLDAERFERVTRFALDEPAHRRLAQVAKDNGIAFFSAAISEDWVPLIAELGAAIKIASGDLTFEPVIAAAARTDRPVILSTGAGSGEEVATAVEWFRAAAGTQQVSDRLALLHCVSAYPAPIEEANLLSIPFLREKFGLTTGWSNHVLGPEACLAAVALGAQIVEVHVTDRKQGRDFRDHELSFEPDELAGLVAAVKRVRSGLGQSGKFAGPSEIPIREAIRKGISAARDIPQGHVLSEEDVRYARPATEFPSAEIASVIGKVATSDIRAGETIARGSLAVAESS